MRAIQALSLGLLILGIVPRTQAANDKSVQLNYERRALAVTPGPSVVDRAAAGERLDYLTGEFYITHVDATLPGTGPTAGVVRTFSPGEASREGPFDGPFGDWQFDLPRITTLTLGTDARPNWVVEGDQPAARCTRFGKPPSSNGIDPTTWWSGYQLALPGEVPQELVQRSANNTRMPQMQDDSGKALSFPILTTSQWQVTCLGATTNGEAGEAFIAISPNGMKHYFTHLVYEAVTPVAGPNGEEIQRHRANMLPTRIVDRHGNAVDFIYDKNKLVRIERPGEVALDIG